ncbi:LD-carboxypeptidase [Mesobacillus foraminis]|uniref:S66 peptidase family protein n=1 Tax=Mesobacillus foraminis TaxID=279826 RepID=UPI001BEBBEC1|nr:LD-carboxypeptidase [Mesobacillus foraminis]MBT2755102.1 LD-carboxypeptidase [Mesobacillus foraminis]
MSIKPVCLKKGDTVGIIAPAGPPRRDALARGVNFLEGRGLNIKLGRYVHSEHGYLSGTDEERLEDLHSMFRDKEIKAIFCARGGYGTARIASMIDYELLRSNPKIFWGYSDITFLHLAIMKQCEMVTFHGPMIASDFGREKVHSETEETFLQVFGAAPAIYTKEQLLLESIVEGSAAGSLTGGNLTLITSTLGTKFEIETDGRILFIEEINEEPRAVDRMLNQLYMAGKLEKASGMIVGDFHNCIPDSEPSFSVEEVVSHYLHLAGKPAIKGLKIGHCTPNIAIPLGSKAFIDTSRKVVFVENGTIIN